MPIHEGTDRNLPAAPVEWVGQQLADLEGILERARAPAAQPVAHDPVRLMLP